MNDTKQRICLSLETQREFADLYEKALSTNTMGQYENNFNYDEIYGINNDGHSSYFDLLNSW